MLLSEYIGVDHNTFKKHGILDTFIELDANYYINIFALKETKIPQFKNSYKVITNHFTTIFKILNSYINTGNQAFYDKAMSMFYYPEVNEVGLGLSQGNYGRGLTSFSIRKTIIDLVIDLIKEGNKEPEMFFLIGILSKGIGVDLISDMISNIIINDIKQYTKDMNMLMFNKDNYIFNKMKNCNCYYIPLEIVDEIPLPQFMYEIDSLIRLNEDLRNYLNKEIGADFFKASIEVKAKNISTFIKNSDCFNEIFEMYKNYKYTHYDFNTDDVGIIKLIETYLNFPKIKFDGIELESKVISLHLINEFKTLIENTGIYEPFLGKSTKVKEKNCQNLFYVFAKKQFEQFNFDLSPECNQGRGPSDFKVSYGDKDKCVIEVKLLSNQQYLHGIDVQIIEYAKAENCQKLVYFVFDDLYDREKAVDRLNEINEVAVKKRLIGYDIDVITVRVEKKKSASKF